MCFWYSIVYSPPFITWTIPIYLHLDSIWSQCSLSISSRSLSISNFDLPFSHSDGVQAALVRQGAEEMGGERTLAHPNQREGGARTETLQNRYVSQMLVVRLNFRCYPCVLKVFSISIAIPFHYFDYSTSSISSLKSWRFNLKMEIIYNAMFLTDLIYLYTVLTIDASVPYAQINSPFQWFDPWEISVCSSIQRLVIFVSLSCWVYLSFIFFLYILGVL